MEKEAVYRQLTPEEEREARIRAKNIMLWLFLGSATLFFAAFTSVYVVRKDGANWFEFDLPQVFATSTVVLLASSLTVGLAQWIIRKEQPWAGKVSGLLLLLSLVLGLWFGQLQWAGYGDLVDMRIFLIDNVTGNVSGSFFYIITGAHFVHVISGLLALLIAAVQSFRGKYGPKNHHGLRRTAIYWHFLDLLWLYLFLFLTYADQLF